MVKVRKTQAEVTVPIEIDTPGWRGTFTYNRVTMDGLVVIEGPDGLRITTELAFAADWAPPPPPPPVRGRGSLRGV